MILPKNSKDVPALRTFLTALRTQACASGEAFSGAPKEMRDDLVQKLDAFIGEIPPGDVPGDWCMESKLDQLCALLAASIAQASLSALEVAKLKAESATQLAGAVAAALKSKLEAGELVTQAAHTAALTQQKTEADNTAKQLCADARNLGSLEGEKKVRDEITAAEQTRQLIAARKSALQKAGKPLPEVEFENVLAGTEDQFQAVVAQYDTRLAALKKAGVQLAGSPLLAKLFQPEANYKSFESVVTSIDALKTPPVEIAGGTGAETKPGKTPLIV